MSENINNIDKNTSFTYYLNEYLVLLLYAVGIVGITVGSHKIGIPLYKINPMHWVLYFYILLNKPHFSSIIMISILMPISSFLLTGHPTFIKGLLIVLELVMYGSIFVIMIKKSSKYIIPAFIISQVFGKTAYYGIKYLLIRFTLMDGSIFSTSLIYQVIISSTMMITIYCGLYIKNSIKN